MSGLIAKSALEYRRTGELRSDPQTMDWQAFVHRFAA